MPGEPSAFGTAAPVGPAVSIGTFTEAEKLVQVQLTEAERTQAAATWASDMAPLYERRTGPRKIVLPLVLRHIHAGIRCCRENSRDRRSIDLSAGRLKPDRFLRKMRTSRLPR